MLTEYIAFIIGIICAGIGGELFLRGIVGVARWKRIPPGIVATTFAAFATSSPEFAVSITAASEGTPEIAFGNALGANVINVALVLGLALMFGSIYSPRGGLHRDIAVALAAPALTFLLAIDGMISQIDGLLLLGLFAGWLFMVLTQVRNYQVEDQAIEIMTEHRIGIAIASGVVGLVSLFLAGQLIVFAARGIAAAFDIEGFIIGALIIAVGTTLPELATVLISRIRGQDEVGLGTILGSNIFNGLVIVSAASIIEPITADIREVCIALTVGFLAVALAFPSRAGTIAKTRGVLLLALYLVYVAVIASE